jgi:hypothetical protein
MTAYLTADYDALLAAGLTVYPGERGTSHIRTAR